MVISWLLGGKEGKKKDMKKSSVLLTYTVERGKKGISTVYKGGGEKRGGLKKGASKP